MMNYCGADCENCQTKDKCKGCMETCGSPFGGTCVAAEYIKANGIEAYKDFKKQLIDEINDLLVSCAISPSSRSKKKCSLYLSATQYRFILP